MTEKYFTENPAIKDKMLSVVKDVLGDNFTYGVGTYTSMSRENLAIWAACSPIDINNVRGQKPQIVSLMWWNWGANSDELLVSYHCGQGGRNVKCVPDKENPAEKHYAMVPAIIPFRKASGEVAVYKAARKFFENYLKVLRENKHRLMYKDIVDYDKLLG